MQTEELPAPYPAPGNPTRICSWCQKNRPVDDFDWVNGRTRLTQQANGRRSICKECQTTRRPGQNWREQSLRDQPKDWEKPR